MLTPRTSSFSSSKERNIQFAVMAGGESRRFGGCKLLEDWQDGKLVDHNLLLFKELGIETSYLITGAYHHELSRHIMATPKLDGVRVLYNSCWSMGLGESLAFCSRALRQEDPLCVVLADQVALKTFDFATLIDAAKINPEKIVCTKFTNYIGPPVIFPRAVRHQLNHLSGSEGAKNIINSAGDDVIFIELKNAQLDVDTREDLNHAYLENKRSNADC